MATIGEKLRARIERLKAKLADATEAGDTARVTVITDALKKTEAQLAGERSPARG